MLAAGRAQDAEQVYLADLRRFPENGWSLLGLAKSLEAQGQTDAAKATQKRFRKAWRLGDVSISIHGFSSAELPTLFRSFSL